MFENISSEGDPSKSIGQQVLYPHAKLLGVRVDAISQAFLIDLILERITNTERLIVMYANAHVLNLAYENPSLRSALNQADVVFCDGYGVKWAGKLINRNLPERFTPPDWVDLLCTEFSAHGYSFFLLGAKPGITEKAAKKLRYKMPDLQIKGTFHGYFNKTQGHPENEAVLSEINRQAPDLLMVGFGSPLQEMWAIENREHLSPKVILTVGALFDVLSGEVHRAPSWMTRRGIEWLGRLYYDPKRLWKRYLLGNPLFIWRVIRQRLGILKLD